MHSFKQLTASDETELVTNKTKDNMAYAFQIPFLSLTEHTSILNSLKRVQ